MALPCITINISHDTLPIAALIYAACKAAQKKGFCCSSRGCCASNAFASTLLQAASDAACPEHTGQPEHPMHLGALRLFEFLLSWVIGEFSPAPSLSLWRNVDMAETGPPCCMSLRLWLGLLLLDDLEAETPLLSHRCGIPNISPSLVVKTSPVVLESLLTVRHSFFLSHLSSLSHTHSPSTASREQRRTCRTGRLPQPTATRAEHRWPTGEDGTSRLRRALARRLKWGTQWCHLTRRAASAWRPLCRRKWRRESSERSPRFRPETRPFVRRRRSTSQTVAGARRSRARFRCFNSRRTAPPCLHPRHPTPACCRHEAAPMLVWMLVISKEFVICSQPELVCLFSCLCNLNREFSNILESQHSWITWDVPCSSMVGHTFGNSFLKKLS